MSGAVLALAAVLILGGCTSPEVKRTRGGGPGADVGNRGAVVQMHEGSQPYYETPRLIDSRYAAATSAQRDDQASRR
jgi:hypothetical protein